MVPRNHETETPAGRLGRGRCARRMHSMARTAAHVAIVGLVMMFGAINSRAASAPAPGSICVEVAPVKWRSMIYPTGISASSDRCFIVTGFADGDDGWIGEIASDGTIRWCKEIPMDQSTIRTNEKYLAAPVELDDHGRLMIGRTSAGLVAYYFRGDGEGLSISWRANDSLGSASPVGAVATAPFMGGAVAFGMLYKSAPNTTGGTERIVTPWYWLVFFDAHGAAKKSLVFPCSGIAFGQSAGIQVGGRKLILASTDNIRTELLEVDERGALLGRRMFAGAYQLVRSDFQGLKLIGGPMRSPYTEVITLGESLVEIARERWSDLPRSAFVSELPIQRSDHSLLLIGNRVHEIGETLTPAAAILREAPHTAELIPLPLGPSVRGTIIKYAAPTSDYSGAAAVEPVAASNSGDNAHPGAQIILVIDRN